MSKPVLRLEELRKSYGETMALRHADEAPRGSPDRGPPRLSGNP
jgi:hypothetical protein